MSRQHFITLSSSLCLALLIALGTATAQTTQFTYQGKLSDGGAPATGTYDMQFRVFDTRTLGTGTQQGPTFTNPSVTVSGGIFTVQLDFGSAVFIGPDRFLEIGVRPAGSGNPYTRNRSKLSKSRSDSSSARSKRSRSDNRIWRRSGSWSAWITLRRRSASEFYA